MILQLMKQQVAERSLRVKSKSLQKSNVFISLLLSYFFVFLIPLLISLVVYAISAAIIEEEVDRAHLGSLRQIKQVVDGKLGEIEKISIEVALDEEIESLSYGNKPFTPIQTYLSVSIMKKINTFKIANDIIDLVGIYFQNNAAVLSSGMYDIDDWYITYFRDIDITYEQYEMLINNNWSGEYIVLPLKNREQDTHAIVYLRSLPVNSISTNFSNLIITIDQHIIKQLVKNIEWASEGTVVILDSNNNVIISTKDIPNMFFSNSLDDRNKTITSLNGEDVIISYINSGVTGWKYVSIIPADIFLIKLKYVRTVTIICIILGFLASAVISFVFTRKNYNPLKRIADIFIGQTGAPMGKLNEYSFIESSVREVMEERKNYIRTLDKQNEFLKNNFLARLLKGRIDKGTNIKAVLKQYNMDFFFKSFAVMLFYIEKVSEAFQESGIEANEDSTELIHFIIKNVVEELAARDNLGYVIEVDNMLTCIMCFNSDDQEKAKTDMYNIANSSKTFFENKFGIQISVSMSNIHHSYTDLPLSYQEAADAMDYMRLIANNFIIQYSSIKKNEAEGGCGIISFEREKKLENTILSRDFAEAERILNQIFEEDIYKSTYPIQILKCKMFGLINIMFTVVHELSINLDDDFLNDLKPIDMLLSCETLPDLKSRMVQILYSLNEFIENKEQNIKLKERIIDYVNTNYCNKELSVASIADVFKLNMSYLSRAFKEQTNMGLLTYIHLVRINSAKKLLEETKMSIKDISEKTGFYNCPSMIRLFKKYEGISPGKYRELKKTKSLK